MEVFDCRTSITFGGLDVRNERKRVIQNEVKAEKM